MDLEKLIAEKESVQDDLNALITDKLNEFYSKYPKLKFQTTINVVKDGVNLGVKTEHSSWVDIKAVI